MPRWLKRQIQMAFRSKNLYQIRLLNQCWFFYQERIPKNSS
ncbi:cortex morphogenetic protein CmpA [Salirhabdus salicampi]|nr:cortex morphogenetic protein CmpA [Salirhabdus salicampi]MCP8618080.1 cortex morphogenetic protein CmpA [Salirhabdus salicampi]